MSSLNQAAQNQAAATFPRHEARAVTAALTPSGSRADKLLRAAREAAQVRAYQVDPDVIALRIERMRTWVDRLIWTGMGLGLAFTAVNVQQFAAGDAVAEPGQATIAGHDLGWWAAWLLDPLVSLILVGALIGEQIIGRYRLKGGPWVRALKWVALGSTYAMNTWSAWEAADPALILLHSIPPVMVFCAAEAVTDLRHLITEAVDRAYNAAVDRARARQRAADAAQVDVERPAAPLVASVSPPARGVPEVPAIPGADAADAAPLPVPESPAQTPHVIPPSPHLAAHPDVRGGVTQGRQALETAGHATADRRALMDPAQSGSAAPARVNGTAVPRTGSAPYGVNGGTRTQTRTDRAEQSRTDRSRTGNGDASAYGRPRRDDMGFDADPQAPDYRERFIGWARAQILTAADHGRKWGPGVDGSGTPSYEDLAALTDRKRSWLEKALREARNAIFALSADSADAAGTDSPVRDDGSAAPRTQDRTARPRTDGAEAPARTRDPAGTGADPVTARTDGAPVEPRTGEAGGDAQVRTDEVSGGGR